MKGRVVAPASNDSGIEWPNGHSFAFTIFDDTDWTTLQNGPAVYSMLTDLGFSITKSVWMNDPGAQRTTGGMTCDDRDYLEWVIGLHGQGHEVAFHNASDRTSLRRTTRSALDRFESIFGHPPRVGADHAGNREALYAGPLRLSGARRLVYQAASCIAQPNRPRFEGADPASPLYWGDIARSRIEYWRRFSWSTTNTAARSPVLYNDRLTPCVNAWFDSTHAPRLESLLHVLRPAALEALEAERGVCILYTHLGVDSVGTDGRPDHRLTAALERVAEMNGWFAPVSEVLDHVRASKGIRALDRRDRATLERSWMLDRARNSPRIGPRVTTHGAHAA